MTDIPTTSLIKEQYPELTKSGKKVADYIAAHREEAPYMSITALAELCDVAEATVSRFCKALGFESYSEFKLALAKDSSTAQSGALKEANEKISPDDSITEMSRKLLSHCTRAMYETLDFLDEQSISRAVLYLTGARRVFCFGQGGSMVMAMEAWARFSIAAPHFVWVPDAHLQTLSVSLCSINDVVLFFSYSGATKEIMDILRTARANGAKVILVTHFKKSPAAALADVLLLCGSKESPLETGSVPAKMGQLLLIDVLYTEYCRQNPEFSLKNRESTADAIATRLL